MGIRLGVFSAREKSRPISHRSNRNDARRPSAIVLGMNLSTFYVVLCAQRTFHHRFRSERIRQNLRINLFDFDSAMDVI